MRDEINFRHTVAYKKSLSKDGKSRFRVTYSGREAITAALREMRYYIAELETASDFSKSQVATVYENHVHKRFESRFSPYYRIIYTILTKIKNDKILKEKEKIFYANLLRSQLNSHEVAMIAINALSPVSKDLSSLIEEFRLLKYIPPGSTQRRLGRFYSSQAFEPRD